MGLDANNNGGIIYRIARSNLAGKKLYTFFSVLTIMLSLTFVMTIVLFLQETRTAKQRMLGRMQHVMYMDMPEQQMEQAARDERVELLLPYKESGETFEIGGVKYGFTYQAGGIVIYTIFYLSVISRTQQIGQLRTIGMTEKQIRKMVRREGFWLCAVSVPAALAFGGDYEEYGGQTKVFMSNYCFRFALKPHI